MEEKWAFERTSAAFWSFSTGEPAEVKDRRRLSRRRKMRTGAAAIDGALPRAFMAGLAEIAETIARNLRWEHRGCLFPRRERGGKVFWREPGGHVAVALPSLTRVRYLLQMGLRERDQMTKLPLCTPGRFPLSPSSLC